MTASFHHCREYPLSTVTADEGVDGADCAAATELEVGSKVIAVTRESRQVEKKRTPAWYCGRAQMQSSCYSRARVGEPACTWSCARSLTPGVVVLTFSRCRSLPLSWKLTSYVRESAC